MFTQETWFRSSLPVVELVISELGEKNVVKNISGHYSAHPTWDFLHTDEFDPSPFLPALRPKLDALGWQLVTTRSKISTGGVEYPCVTTAPLLRVENLPDIVYHVTERRRFESIMREGLLPSTTTRNHTLFPDTEGKIHASLRLETADGLGDGAAFWMREFPRKVGGTINDYGIIRVDVRELPLGTRVYRDTHSHWGVVFDSLDRIDPDKLCPMTQSEVDELLARCGTDGVHKD